jgi:hypothetical protein
VQIQEVTNLKTTSFSLTIHKFNERRTFGPDCGRLPGCVSSKPNLYFIHFQKMALPVRGTSGPGFGRTLAGPLKTKLMFHKFSKNGTSGPGHIRAGLLPDSSCERRTFGPFLCIFLPLLGPRRGAISRSLQSKKHFILFDVS